MTQDMDERKNGKNAGDSAMAEDLDTIQMRFMEEWEAGAGPTLQAYVERYPQFMEELTDFVLDFVQMEAALAHTPEPTTPSPEAERARELALAGPQGPASSLSEVRKKLDWPVGRLAREANIPAEIATWMEQGLLTDYPSRFERRLSEVISRSPALVAIMLRAPASQPARAAHFHAQGLPTDQPARRRTFREAIEECDRMGKLTPEMRREWLKQETG